MRSLHPKYKLILASSSPRRKELLSLLGLPFSIDVPEVDESLNASFSLIDQCKCLAQKKAEVVFNKNLTNAINHNEGLLVIGADTLVSIDEEILEKPTNTEVAKSMLKKLSGKTHDVVTGICLLYTDDKNQIHIFNTHSLTKVEFHPLSDQLIEHYLSLGESLDKSGAYGIQGFAQGFVKSLHGSYANVVGLPLDVLVVFLENAFNKESGFWKKMF